MLPKTLGITLVAALTAGVAAVNISISSTTTHAIPATLYGYMWEDINHSGDGGLYGELLQNRAFQVVSPGSSAALNAWTALNGVNLSVTTSTTPVSSALPNSLQVTLGSGTTGTVGFANTGFWGIKVQSGWTYTGSFYAKSSNYAGAIKVSLQSKNSKTVYAIATPVSKVTGKYTKYSFTLKPTASAPDEQNVFAVQLTATGSAAQVYFGLFSLFPPTFKNRPNGMRIDLAQAMAGTAPKIWRFPGGNNLEGETIQTRWKWNETIGPLEQRPGRQGDWGYPNTDGLGLMEYMQWAEDLGAEVILGVWAGLSLNGNPKTVPQNQLQPYIDDVINEIHFLTDASTTTWGALRAKYGRTDPYPLTYVEIGNEDFFEQTSYQAYRWPMFVNQLKAAFPTLKFIDTAYSSLSLTPAPTHIDYHNYNTPEWFASNAQMFDSYSRSGPQYFVGEYAVISTNASDIYGTPATGRLTYPIMQGSAAEAAFMTGMERNSDVVFASAYAPSLNHVNGSQWTPNLISYNSQTLVKSTSYYVQQMFAQNLGTHVLSTTPAAGSSPVWWVASVNQNTGTYYLKVANTGGSSVSATISLGFTVATTAQTTAISGSQKASNTITSPKAVIPVSGSVAVTNGKSLTYTFPAYSAVVFKFTKAGSVGTITSLTTAKTTTSPASSQTSATIPQYG